MYDCELGTYTTANSAHIRLRIRRIYAVEARFWPALEPFAGKYSRRSLVARQRARQGYLTHEKQPPLLGLSLGPRHSPTVGSSKGAVSYARGTPVHVFSRELLRIHAPVREREFFIDSLLVRIHYIIAMIRWTGPAPWEFEFHFAGSIMSTFPRVYILAYRWGLGTWCRPQTPNP